MPSPACEVKVGAGAYAVTSGGIDATPAAVVTIRLISQADVRSWLIQCITTDELSDADAVTAALTIDTLAKTATFTAPIAGRAYRFQSQINGGVGPNGVIVPAYTETFGIYTLTAASRRVLAADETTESDPVFGYISSINDIIRNPASGGGEANTNSSVGGGAQLNKTKVGVDLPLRSIVGALGSAAVQQTDTVEIYGLGIAPLTNAGTGALADVASGTGGVPASGIRFTGAAPEVGSIAEPTNGRILVVHATGGPLVLVNESGGTAANRIITSTGANLTIADEGSALLKYDGTSSRWRVIATSANGSVVAAHDGVRVTSVGSTYTVHGVEGACSPETFGAIGDGTTDDTTAMQDMVDALEAGTYTHAELGAKTYKITTGLVFNASAKLSIRGQGPASKIYATNAVTAAALLIRNATDIHLEAFEIYGDATFNTAGVNTAAGGGTGQNAIEVGYLGGDGTSRLRIINVSAHNLGGRGLSFAYGPDIRGPVITNFSATECLVGIYALDASAITDFKAWKCGTGLYNAGGGNVFVVGGDIVNCATGMRLGAGSNDTHGAVVGMTIRHSGTNAIKVEAINNGHVFVSCTFYEGNMLFDGGNAGEVVFSACLIDCTFYTLAGNALFTGCRFDQAYIITPATDFVTTGGRNIFERLVRDINGTIPSFIGDVIDNSFSFAANANETLTAQKSVADYLVITDGAAATARQITSTLAPNKGYRFGFYNAGAFDHTFKYSSGTAVTLKAGQRGVVGADGTNAVLRTDQLIAGSNITLTPAAAGITVAAAGGGGFTAGGDLSGSSSSQTVERVKGTTITTAGGALPVGAVLRTTAVGTADWGALDLADADARTGTLPVGNGGTGVTSLGTSPRLLKNNSGVVGDCANVTHDGTGLVMGTSGYYAYGSTNPTNDGVIRVASAAVNVICGRNSVNTADITVVGFSAGNGIFVGTDASFTAAKQCDFLACAAASGGYMQLGLGSASYFLLQGGLNKIGKPTIGMTANSAPWGSDGDVDIVMADANKTLTAAEYAMKIWRFTGTVTANRTVTVQAVAATEGYTKEVWVDINTDFAVILSTGSGKTVTVKGTATGANISRVTISVTDQGVVAHGGLTNTQISALGN